MELFSSSFRDPGPTKVSSFEGLSQEEVDAHCAISTYEGFELTEAIRPAYNLPVLPRRGYRQTYYRDRASGTEVPVLMVAETKPKLLPLFYALLEELQELASGVVHVVLEGSHDRAEGEGHDDYRADYIDYPVLLSYLYDTEDLLLNDGCTGIAVFNNDVSAELQLDEHKLFAIYGRSEIFECVLCEYAMPHEPTLRFITEAEHIHVTQPEHKKEFERLRKSLGADLYQDI